MDQWRTIKRKYHDRVIKKKEIAKMCPFKWQSKENIVYCDYLEHLLLYVLICKYPTNNNANFIYTGIGGIVNFIVPELNDLYSGWLTNQAWRKNCHDKVSSDEKVYLAILNQFIQIAKLNPKFKVDMLCSSFNQQYGLWDDKKNVKIYNKIKSLF